MMLVETTADQSVENEVRRQTIRFSHVDSAGIVFYPRYLELLADSFPEWIRSRPPFKLNLEFKKPIRLGEILEFHSRTNANLLTVHGKSGLHTSFIARLELLQSLELNPSLSIDEGFCRDMLIPDWMTGPNSHLHLSRYFELVSCIIEKWFAEVLEYPFHELHLRDGKSVPTVKLEAALVGLPRAGEVISMQLRVLCVGTKSVRLQTRLVQAGRVLAQTCQVLVFATNSDGELHSTAISAELMDRMTSQICEVDPP